MSQKRPYIYMDYQATTPVDKRVFELMAPYFTEHFGNAASSVHAYGWRAEEAVKQARETIAKGIHAQSPQEIIFTSGATESNNLAILGVAKRYQKKGNHLITVATEHKAVLDPFKVWESQGGKVTVLPVDEQGLVDLNQLEDAITDQTVLISIMQVNNEIGVIQPLADMGKIARAKGVLFHTDASQSAGKLDLHVDDLCVDLVSISGHKIYGPKGVGALYARRRNPRVSLMPLIYGGGHEGGRRSGTLNIPGIVGLAEALKLALLLQEEEQARLLQLRTMLWDGLQDQIPNIYLNGHEHLRLAGNLNVSFDKLELARLYAEIPHLAVSSKSACSSGSLDPSHVLMALGRSEELASSAIRFGLGRFTTEAEVATVIADLSNAVQKVRKTSTRYASV